MSDDDLTDTRAAISEAATSPPLTEQRAALGVFTSDVFAEVGSDLQVAGWIVGPDRAGGTSPFGHGSDEATSVGILLRVAGSLVSASVHLFGTGQAYAAAALLRQLVEVEYLAWAFEARDREAERWLRSTEEQRRKFFTPAKLRKASNGKFRGKDYSYHCEQGGHPVPRATLLLDDDGLLSQILLADLLGHSGRIWDHLVGWSGTVPHGELLLRRGREMSERYGAWKNADPLAKLPPPP